MQFQHLAESAGAGGIAAAKGALAVYGGELLPQDLYEPWADQHRLHLRRLYPELLHQAEDWHQALSADPATSSPTSRWPSVTPSSATEARPCGSSTSSTA